MPNGIDKNWYRMCAAINGFRSRYGDWPTKMRLPEGAIRELFTKGTLTRLEEKLTFVFNGSPYIAEDEKGRSYNYAEERFPGSPPDIQAHDWLNVEPDSQMVKDYYTPRSNRSKTKG